MYSSTNYKKYACFVALLKFLVRVKDQSCALSHDKTKNKKGDWKSLNNPPFIKLVFYKVYTFGSFNSNQGETSLFSLDGFSGCALNDFDLIYRWVRVAILLNSWCSILCTLLISISFLTLLYFFPPVTHSFSIYSHLSKR